MVQPDFKSIWNAAQDIDGWLLEAQARALYDAASLVEPGKAIVEIGSHRGKSTAVIAAAKRDSVAFVAVDPFDDPRWGGGPESLKYFEDNMKAVGMTERVRLFKGLSAEAAAEWHGPTVGFAWIDGAHDRASVLADIDGWLPHLSEGSRIYFHDAFSAIGTTEALLMRLLVTRDVKYLGAVRTLAMFEKRTLRPLEGAVNMLRILGRLVFFAQNISIKIARRRGWNIVLPILRYNEDAGLI